MTTAAQAGAWDRSATLGPLLTGVDEAFDAALGGFRGRRGPDTAAAVVSNLADYGFVWAVVALWKARRRQARRAVVLRLAAAGTSSYLVNKALKARVGRQRPEAVAEGRNLAVRTPTSSSFPSGHTLAAFCTAVVLADGPVQTAAFGGFALTVAGSRIHLGAHHASDVLAGAVVGTVLGLAVRRVLRR